MQKADKRGEQMSFYRFFNNEKVTEEALAGCMEDHCLKQCAGLKEAVLTGDTSEINLERNRMTDREGLTSCGERERPWVFLRVFLPSDIRPGDRP
jgi:hypothetical protein